MREVKQHSWFAGIDWAKLCKKQYKAPLIPGDVMQIKFYKEHNRFPTEADEGYILDTRFFSPKYTKRDVGPIQKIVDQLQLNGSKIPVAIPRQRF